MPIRRNNRGQAWLVPPTVDELVPGNHPVRFVADFIASLPTAWWTEAGIDVDGAATGAPGYDPKVLLSIWVFGFMDRKRSTRELEQACQRDVYYWWLAGRQTPDHNTLARFYQRHRPAIRKLFETTVRVAVQSGLVHWAVQAIDGTRIPANAANDQSMTATRLQEVLRRLDAAIDQLESELTGAAESAEAVMPVALVEAQARRNRITAALAQLQGTPAGRTVNLTDPEATIVKTRDGLRPGYNGQAVVGAVPMPPGEADGRIVLGGSLTQAPNDQHQLIAQITNARELTGREAELVLADAGYVTHTAIAAPEAPTRGHARSAKTGPFGLTDFVYAPETDTFTCPNHCQLTFRGLKPDRRNGRCRRHYRADQADCQGCPLATRCLPKGQASRLLRTPPELPAMARHRRWMAHPDAIRWMSRRKGLIEPVFGTLKSCFGLRRAYRRGLANVESEWYFGLATINLRTLSRCWANGHVQLG